MIDLIGTWKLVEYTMQIEGQSDKFFPMGQNPEGYLIYTPTHVSVHSMTASRKLFPDLESSIYERGKNYAGYIGTYKIEGDVITHYPLVSSFVDFIDTPQVRNFKINKKILVLNCSYYDHDRKANITSELSWEKTT